MVTCSCGKTIDKIPVWLSRAKVEFVCKDCPNRHHKNIATVSAEIDRKLAAAGAETVGSGMDFPDEDDQD
jgi:hypothetical protein